MLKFSDGMTFDTGGPPRIETRPDGLYVVGAGMVIPVIDAAEAEAGRTQTDRHYTGGARICRADASRHRGGRAVRDRSRLGMLVSPKSR